MKEFNFQRLIFYLYLALIMKVTNCQQQIMNPEELQINRNSQSNIEQKQYQIEQKFKKQVEEQLSQWVVEQLNHNQKHPQIQPHQSSIFMIQSNVTHNYRILSIPKSKKLISVSVFEMTKEGEIVLPQNPPKQNFLQFFTLDDKNGLQYTQGIVYISKIFQIQFSQTYKYLKFKNRAQHSVIVLLDIQEDHLIVDSMLGDDKFAVTKSKINAILEESKNSELNREHLYKWQWGFYQKQERHQADMLGFTVVQLLIIITTSIVQMYCIKNVVDDQVII